MSQNLSFNSELTHRLSPVHLCQPFCNFISYIQIGTKLSFYINDHLLIPGAAEGVLLSKKPDVNAIILKECCNCNPENKTV